MILILLAYYERPKMVLNALKSIKQNHQVFQDWMLAVCDDNSLVHPAKPIVEKYLVGLEDKIVYLKTTDTPEDKKRLGSNVGGMLNTAVSNIKSDVVIVLCDDDALCPAYLLGLHEWYEANPRVLSSYCKVIGFNPLVEKPEMSLANRPDDVPTAFLNQWTGPIAPSCKVDSAQVSWRPCCEFQYGAWHPDRAQRNQDAYFYNQLTIKTGLTVPNNLVGQFKGFHAKQLGWRSADDAWTVDTDIEGEIK